MDCSFLAPLWEAGIYNMSQITAPHSQNFLTILGVKRQVKGSWPRKASEALRLIRYLASLQIKEDFSLSLLRAKSLEKDKENKKKEIPRKLAAKWSKSWAIDNQNPIIITQPADTPMAEELKSTDMQMTEDPENETDTEEEVPWFMQKALDSDSSDEDMQQMDYSSDSEKNPPSK